MLRAQAFEGLFTLVPILLVAVVSIFLRARAANRRRQREEAAGDAAGRGAPARGAAGRGAPAQTVQTQDIQTQGVQTQGASAGGKKARDAKRRQGALIPADRSGRSARGTPARGTPARGAVARGAVARGAVARGAPAVEPFIPQQAGGSPMTGRESYAYPPPLSFNQAGQEPASGAGLRAASASQQVVRLSLESRMAVERMGPSRDAQTGRPLKRVLVKTERPSPKTAVMRGSSISTRLERLPPLKRAVIWAEILGPPGGRQ